MDREEIIRHETRLQSLGKQLTTQNSNGCAPIGARRTLERVYGDEYQVLVRLGVKQQIRGKYRR